MPATATFVIDFGGIEDAYLVAELDSVKNFEKSSFTKGDAVHFKVYSDINYTIETSSGIVTGNSVGKVWDNSVLVSEDHENEVLQFVKGAKASVSKKIDTITAQTWYPNDPLDDHHLGAITAISNTEVQAADADEDTLGIASIDYTSLYAEHTISGPPLMDDIWHIIIYIKATA
jgi:hypothetical protein